MLPDFEKTQGILEAKIYITYIFSALPLWYGVTIIFAMAKIPRFGPDHQAPFLVVGVVLGNQA